jgi:predicted nuclease of predicted toxin-antitoxin system
MKFFLDENFPAKARIILSEQENEVYDVRGTENEGLSDSDIFHRAQQLQALFLTTDRDFFHTIHFNYKPHCGIVVINLKNPNSDRIIDKLNWFLSNYTNKNHFSVCYLITDTKCMVYQ